MLVLIYASIERFTQPFVPQQRNNIGNARLAGLERDLGLKGFQFNILLTIFCEHPHFP